jgi:hypothetical protein
LHDPGGYRREIDVGYVHVGKLDHHRAHHRDDPIQEA